MTKSTTAMASYEYRRPICGVDVVVLTLARDPEGNEGGEGRLALRTLLTRRANEPFLGEASLPGAHVHADADETLEATARRLLAQKCGVVDNGRRVHLEQLATWGDATRDPRDWSITVGYLALVARAAIPERPDTVLARVHPLPATPATKGEAGVEGLPFDHDAILAAGVERLRGRATYTSLPTRMLAPTFRISELQQAYEAATRRELNASWFRNTMLKIDVGSQAKPQPFLVQRGSVATRTRSALTYAVSTPDVATFHQRF